MFELRTEVGSHLGRWLGFSHMALLADRRAATPLLGRGDTLAREGRPVAWSNSTASMGASRVPRNFLQPFSLSLPEAVLCHDSGLHLADARFKSLSIEETDTQDEAYQGANKSLQQGRLVPNRKRSTSRLYIVTPLI